MAALLFLKVEDEVFVSKGQTLANFVNKKYMPCHWRDGLYLSISETNKQKQKLSTTMTSNCSSHKSLQLLLENKPTMTKRYLLPNCGGEEGWRYLKFSGSDFCPCPIFTELCCWQVTETSLKILSKLPSQRWFTTMISLGISVWVKWSVFSNSRRSFCMTRWQLCEHHNYLQAMSILTCLDVSSPNQRLILAIIIACLNLSGFPW